MPRPFGMVALPFPVKLPEPPGPARLPARGLLMGVQGQLLSLEGLRRARYGE